jgi:hypothetical protein
MRPLRTKTKVLADEYMTESLLKMDQEIKLDKLILKNKSIKFYCFFFYYKIN